VIDLKGNPFYLNEDDVKWVKDTLSKLTDDEKIGQLFCLIGYEINEDYLKNLVKNYKPGGIMARPMPAGEVMGAVKILQQNSKIPMLISANFEHGGSGITPDGTRIGSEMQIGATDEDEMAYKLGVVCGREGAALGANWAFAPIIDIDYNFRNPITNLRTFGSDPDRVKRMGVEYVRGVQEYGVAAAIKHFPGDGMDERDQHLVTSINSLSCEDWDNTYGKAYKASIDVGALTVMAGHIMQPAYSKQLNPEIKDEDILPATLSYELITGLLRNKLGFNGLVVTDASTMAGMMISMKREEAIPRAIAAGCDMVLFTRNIDEDYDYMKKGVQKGIITSERLEEALIRILALKAALGIHKKSIEELAPCVEVALKTLKSKEHMEWARECADKAITLVKEQKEVLPLSPQKYKKVLFYDIESAEGYAYSVRVGASEMVKKLLEKEGFDIDTFVPSKGMEGMMTSSRAIADKYDLIIYVANMGTKSNQTTVRIEWAQPMGANVPVYITSVPTVFISIENPYHLLDVPRVKTYINTYSSSDIVLEALIDKLMGRSEFKGKSPVDAFCGKWDARL